MPKARLGMTTSLGTSPKALVPLSAQCCQTRNRHVCAQPGHLRVQSCILKADMIPFEPGWLGRVESGLSTSAPLAGEADVPPMEWMGRKPPVHFGREIGTADPRRGDATPSTAMGIVK
jgi:hypothetical protein